MTPRYSWAEVCSRRRRVKAMGDSKPGIQAAEVCIGYSLKDGVLNTFARIRRSSIFLHLQESSPTSSGMSFSIHHVERFLLEGND